MGGAVSGATVRLRPRRASAGTPVELPVTESRDDGTFDLRSASVEASKAYKFIVEGKLGRDGPIAWRPLRFGARDLALVLERPGRVGVDVSGLPARVRECLVLELTDPRGIRTSSVDAVTAWRGAEREVPAGTYTLSVSVSATPTHRFRDIVVEPGRLCTDPRLSPLAVELRRARVVDEEGQPRADVDVRYVTQPGAPSSLGLYPGYAGKGGWIEWVVPSAGGVQAWVGSGGAALRPLVDVEEGDTVVLPRYRAQLEVRADLPPGPLPRFRLTPADDTTRARWSEVEVRATVASGRWVAQAVPDGRFTLELMNAFGLEPDVLLRREVDLRAGETLVVRAP